MEIEELLLQEIRYVRGRVDSIHERIDDLSAAANDKHQNHREAIVRLQEQTANIRWAAGKVASAVAAVVSAGIASIISFALRHWLS